MSCFTAEDEWTNEFPETCEGWLSGARDWSVDGWLLNETARVEVDPAVVKLSEAANEISHAYRILSYSESARLSDNGGAANPLKYELSNFPKAWHAQYALEDDYYGELEPFIRGLAKLVGTGERKLWALVRYFRLPYPLTEPANPWRNSWWMLRIKLAQEPRSFWIARTSSKSSIPTKRGLERFDGRTRHFYLD